mmetsp:Transcript_32361/g.69726  ORF Transcript_32361/g.69726 Transcript_32361/m.69726 type:complete len:254 (+) Transcript_32361:196-957(+)
MDPGCRSRFALRWTQSSSSWRVVRREDALPYGGVVYVGVQSESGRLRAGPPSRTASSHEPRQAAVLLHTHAAGQVGHPLIGGVGCGEQRGVHLFAAGLRLGSGQQVQGGGPGCGHWPHGCGHQRAQCGAAVRRQRGGSPLAQSVPQCAIGGQASAGSDAHAPAAAPLTLLAVLTVLGGSGLIRIEAANLEQRQAQREYVCGGEALRIVQQLVCHVASVPLVPVLPAADHRSHAEVPYLHRALACHQQVCRFDV